MRIKYALLLSLVLHASAFLAMDIYLDWKMKNGLLALLQKKGGAKGSKYDGAPVKKPIPPRIVQVEIFSPPNEKGPGPKQKPKLKERECKNGFYEGNRAAGGRRLDVAFARHQGDRLPR